MFPSIMTQPSSDELSRPFWEASVEGRLVAPRCTNCGTFRLPAPPICFVCQHRDVEWVELPGTGTVYSFTVVRHPLAKMLQRVGALRRRASSSSTARRAPGARMIANIIDCDVETLKIGDRVEIVWEHVNDQMAVFRFRPITE